MKTKHTLIICTAIVILFCIFLLFYAGDTESNSQEIEQVSKVYIHIT